VDSEEEEETSYDDEEALANFSKDTHGAPGSGRPTKSVGLFVFQF
jgi:hypothetical protein